MTDMFTLYNNKAQASESMPTLMQDQNLQPCTAMLQIANCKTSTPKQVSLGVGKLCRHNFEHNGCAYMEALIILRIVLATTINNDALPLAKRNFVPRAQILLCACAAAGSRLLCACARNRQILLPYRCAVLYKELPQH